VGALRTRADYQEEKEKKEMLLNVGICYNSLIAFLEIVVGPNTTPQNRLER